MRLDELEIIARIRELMPGSAALTDDCGVVPEAPPGHLMLVTTDLMEEGQHFRMAWHPPALLGRKLLMVNLSDLDASGAAPLGFTLTLALGKELDPAWLDAFLTGLADAAQAADVLILGGDTVGRPSGLGLGITAFGAAKRWLQRDGVKVGDRLFVDQPLGASARGLQKLMAGQRWEPEALDPDLSAHLDPRPDIGLGVRLAELPEVHACIDLSDGLAKDLRMLAEASGLSLLLDASITEEERQGGEDYARCFASNLSQQVLEQRLGVTLREVARAIPLGEAPLLVYDDPSGARPLRDTCFDHFAP